MSTWDAKLIAPSSPHASLLQQVHALFQQQRATWKVLRDGEAGLAAMKIKRFSLDGRRIVVQANPGRAVSTHAKVDPASVAGRPCFLCPGSLPPLERGISFGDYVLLPNPYPILKHHMTIAFRSHVPQLLEGRLNDLCALARALGPEMFVIYNGPRCGASAPDHLHFQACSSEGVPLFEQLPLDSGNDQVLPLTIWGRNMLVCSFGEAERAAARIQSIASALKDITVEQGEPMMNVVALYRNGRHIITIFPRAKHRSACYFAEPRKQISISPAAMEMAGIIVVANIDHFDRVDESVVRSMFEEVTLGDNLYSRLVEAVT
jgi:ATP adenylyltransferase/5',5'''-P-1,P-4-tetraphosphate phosphorylase II